MNRVLLFLFLCLVSYSTARADFVHAYLNTGREYSNPDYGKSSIWVSTTNYPMEFLNNANKAYLPVDVLKSSSQGCTELRFFDNNVTEIGLLKGENENVNSIFNMQGVSVGDVSVGGFYIINGKKVFVE